jgi:hypothetical protein
VTRPRTKLALCCAALALLAGCGGSSGSSKPISSSRAAALENQLSSIASRVGAGACKDITQGSDPNTRVVQQNIDALPSGDVKDALQQSFDRLFQLVEQNCKSERTPTTTTPGPTPTVETSPPQTEPTPPETTPTQTQPSTTPQGGGGAKAPKKNGKGNGAGGAGGLQEGD